MIVVVKEPEPAAPPFTPVTRPVALIEPLVGILLVQVPPPVPSVSCVVCPWHTTSVPLIAVGNAFTVTVAIIAIQPVGMV